MYLEAIYKETVGKIAYLSNKDPVMDLFKDLEKKIEEKTGKELYLLPNRAYKNRRDSSESIRFAPADHERGKSRRHSPD